MALSLNRELLERPTPEELAQVAGGYTQVQRTTRKIQPGDPTFVGDDTVVVDLP